MLRHPIALIPIAMSVAAVAIALLHLAFAGGAPQPDEGTEAHLWQLLMVGQVPIVVFFALTQMARSPVVALRVLALQGAAALAALAPVYLLRW
jgi:hypothetical protein